MRTVALDYGNMMAPLLDGRGIDAAWLEGEGAEACGEAGAARSTALSGSIVTIESGDVILMSGDLRGIVNAIGLSRRTLRTIRNNFIWAYAYNVALIPVAAGVLFPLLKVLLSPMLAAAAMSVSSVFVVTNSLRLRRFQP